MSPTYNDKTEDDLGRQIKPIVTNTAKDGSGTPLFAITDADGHAQTDVLSITAGTNVIGKVRLVTATGDEITDDTADAIQVRPKLRLTGTPFTGSAAISAATAKIAPSAAFRLLRVEIHLNAAPTTSENLVVALDAGDGADYDVVLAKQDLSAGSLTDFVALFGPGFEFESDDVITAAWTNTNTKTYGLRFVYELI